jgi:hypothetical protein
MNTLVYGSDPEFFAGYKKNDELFVLPAAYFRRFLKVPVPNPDDKHPIFIDRWEELGIILMEDGVAFEETILPDTNWENLFNRINIGKALLESELLSKFPEYCLSDVQTVPTISYDVERWQEFKKMPEFMMSMIFGCDRDFDAFNYKVKQPVINALKHNKRYGGGHIHVSGSPIIKEEPVLAIQCLALTAGLAAVAFSSTPELDKERTYLYGKPGKFRPQKYKSTFNGIPDTDFGVEYRTPSNSWTSSFEHAGQIFKWIEIGIRNLLEQKLGLELLPNLEEDLKDTIVNCNQVKAKEMLAFVEAKI